MQTNTKKMHNISKIMHKSYNFRNYAQILYLGNVVIISSVLTKNKSLFGGDDAKKASKILSKILHAFVHSH